LNSKIGKWPDLRGNCALDLSDSDRAFLRVFFAIETIMYWKPKCASQLSCNSSFSEKSTRIFPCAGAFRLMSEVRPFRQQASPIITKLRVIGIC